MSDPQNINEKELIEQGLRMKANGLGSTFIYKFMRDKVADPDIRGRILEAINRPNATNTEKTQRNLREEEKKEARALRNGKYKYEDFQEAIHKLRLIAFAFLFFGVLLLVSTFLFNASSLPQAITSLLGGGLLLLVYKQVEWNQIMNIYVALGVFFAAILVEYLVFGLPDPLIPRLGEFGRRRIINIVTIFNSYSPAIYLGVKIALSYLFFKVLQTRMEVEKLPIQIRRRLGEKV